MAYESMHDKTPVGEIKVLKLPKRTALEVSTNRSYFSENNGLFRKLFKYINQNDIAMTTPVEAVVNPGKMRFFVGNKDKNKASNNSKDVQVIELPEILVVSVGIRGSYTEERYEKGLNKLLAWVSTNPNYERKGTPYGVYWNGPFVPGFLKRSEVHLPIKQILPKDKPINQVIK